MNMIRGAYLSLVSDDSEPYPFAQATLSGYAADFTRLSVYGVCSNPPKDSYVLLLNAQGQASLKYGIVNDFLNRKKDLKEGEVALVNTKTGSYIWIKEDGNLELLGEGDFAVRYLELETAFNQLQSDHDALVTAFNTHTHTTTATIGASAVPGVIAPVTAPELPSTADITPAKIEEIEVPA